MVFIYTMASHSYTLTNLRDMHTGTGTTSVIHTIHHDNTRLLSQHLTPMSITHIAPLSYDPTLPPSTEHVGQLAENNIAQILTWKQIIQLPTNLTWRASWYEMLDQYMVQGMFGKPMKKPNDTNALHMLWTYHIYNGNPNTKDPLPFGTSMPMLLMQPASASSGPLLHKKGWWPSKNLQHYQHDLNE
jgi:hypothetical protein